MKPIFEPSITDILLFFVIGVVALVLVALFKRWIMTTKRRKKKEEDNELAYSLARGSRDKESMQIEIVDLPFKYVDLEGETVEEKFLDYMIHYIPEVVELENLPLMLPTRETAIGFLEDEIVRSAMLNFTLRYGKDVGANPRFIASSVVDRMTEKGWLPRELKTA